jgi:hypothetical protein
MKSLTKPQKELLEIIKTKGLRKDPRGYYYTKAPTFKRRNGQYKYSQKSIDALLKGKYITVEELPTF